MKHEEKIQFHNAITDLANRYAAISDGMKIVARELSRQECCSLTDDKAMDILNRLPCRDTDEDEAKVELFLQRFFS